MSVSSSAGRTTSSRLAESFSKWSWGTQIRLLAQPFEPASPLHATQLVQLRNKALQVPTWMADKESHFYAMLKDRVAWPSSYQKMLETLITDVQMRDCAQETFTETESLCLSYSLPTILGVSLNLQDLLNSDLPFKEATWRLPVDELTYYIFRRTPSTECLEFRTECTIPLPLSNYSDIKVGETAIADTVVLMHKRHFFFPSAPIPVQMECSFLKLPQLGNLDIPQWVCEYKRNIPNANQLLYDLGVAQFQRRALGFTDHLIFGGGCVKGKLEVYSSWWENNFVHIVPFMAFELQNPLQCVQFFLFLRGVFGYFEGLAGSFNSLTMESVVKAQERQASWRCPPPAPPKNGSGSKRSEMHSPIQEDLEDHEHAEMASDSISTDSDEGTMWTEQESRMLSKWRRDCHFHFERVKHAGTFQEVNLADYSVLIL